MPPPWAALAEEVKTLCDAGLAYQEIAARLKCKPHWVAKALAWWHAERGLSVPDGRKVVRRPRLNRADKLSDQAKTLWDQDLGTQEIAGVLGCDRNLASRAFRRWFEARGLPAPDNRRRWRERHKQRAAGGSNPKDPTRSVIGPDGNVGAATG